MTDAFFEQPILNSPYREPTRHWELDPDGQPTQKKTDKRRPAEFITPIPKPRRRDGGDQASLALGGDQGLSTDKQQYAHTAIINGVRALVDEWRRIPNANDWKVTAETARLLQHWRTHEFSSQRPFFCQIEAVETAIWLAAITRLRKEGVFIGMDSWMALPVGHSTPQIHCAARARFPLAILTYESHPVGCDRAHLGHASCISPIETRTLM
jgi:hypothetical protein